MPKTNVVPSLTARVLSCAGLPSAGSLFFEFFIVIVLSVSADCPRKLSGQAAQSFFYRSSLPPEGLMGAGLAGVGVVGGTLKAFSTAAITAGST